jgi:hypothetical protein
MLEWLESLAAQRTELSISMLLDMHRMVFEDSWPEGAGQFRQSEVKIRLMSHMPPHFSQISELLQQRFAAINERLFSYQGVSEDNFFEILDIAATRRHWTESRVSSHSSNRRTFLADESVLYGSLNSRAGAPVEKT